MPVSSDDVSPEDWMNAGGDKRALGLPMTLSLGEPSH
jgi:hypothetical protein